MPRSLAALLLLSAATAAVPAVAVADPIIGGSATVDSDYPAVGIVGANGALCTGELIDPEWIMTAAHCLDPAVLGLTGQDEVTAATQLILGTVNAGQRQNASTPKVQATFIDPQWNHDHFGEHDLGLIHLLSEYTQTGSGVPVAPLAVNFIASLAPTGIEVTMVGFGTTSGSAGATAGIEFAVGAQKSESCGDFSVGSGASLDDDDLLCFSQAQMTGTCEGDSGGPLIAMIGGVQKIVGTTSFGDQSCTVYGAYTRTDAEIEFIKAHIPALCAGNACIDPNPPDKGGCDAGQGGLGGALALLAVCYRRRSKTSSSPSTS